MDFNEYQRLAERTANRGIEDGNLVRYANFGMGIAGEAGEVCNCLKKVVFHGHPLDREKLKEELGDTLWYIATIATTTGITIEEVAIANIEKLKARYPDGFSEERSINRGDGVNCQYCRHYVLKETWCSKHNDGRLPDEDCSDASSVF